MIEPAVMDSNSQEGGEKLLWEKLGGKTVPVRIGSEWTCEKISENGGS